jgi:hypothetical protein
MSGEREKARIMKGRMLSIFFGFKIMKTEGKCITFKNVQHKKVYIYINVV